VCISSFRSRFKSFERPEPCRTCGRPAWWNGFRCVLQVILDAFGVVREQPDIPRRRARCSDRTCPGGSWTVYEEDGYPHRTFQLGVVASAVGEVAVGGATISSSAKHHRCNRRSVRRWIDWVGSLADVADLTRAAARLDPDGLPPPRPPEVSDPGAPATRVLVLVDHLVRVLSRRGVDFPRATSSLGQILIHQFRRFGDVAFLTRRSSPPLPMARLPALV